MTIRIVLLSLLCACAGADSNVAGVVDRDDEPGIGSVRVHFDRTWIDPVSSPAADVEDGSFRVPRSARAVTVFEDVNGNGRLEPGAEPHAPCLLDGTWSCAVRRIAVRLHQRSRFVDGALSHTTFATGDAYTSLREPDGAFAICNETGTCSEAGLGGFADVAPGTHVLRDCGWRGSPSPDPLRLVVRSRDGEHPVDVVAMPELFVHHQVRARQDEIVVSVTADRGIDRAVAWLGRVGDDRIDAVTWHSGHAKAGRFVRRNAFEVIVPRSAMESATTLVVQLVSLDVASDEILVARYASTELVIDVEELR